MFYVIMAVAIAAPSWILISLSRKAHYYDSLNVSLLRDVAKARADKLFEAFLKEKSEAVSRAGEKIYGEVTDPSTELSLDSCTKLAGNIVNDAFAVFNKKG